jgi:hypothetical protein
LAGCTDSPESRVAEVVKTGDCEGAAKQISRDDTIAGNFVDGVREASGSTASYGITAAGYTADVVITGTVGIIAVTAFCPVFIAEIAACAASKGACGSRATLGCFGDPFDHLPSADDKGSGRQRAPASGGAGGRPPSIGPGLGSKAYAGTEAWREDTQSVALVHQMRAVAGCYERRDTRDDLIKASLQLTQVHESRLYDRIGRKERDAVDGDLDRVKTRLSLVDPEYQRELDRKNRELAQSVMSQQAPVLWRDMHTGSMWRFQPAVVKDGEHAKVVCDGAAASGYQLWQMPTRADAASAVKHGIVDPKMNAAFAEARAHGRRAFVRDGGRFAAVDLTTGDVVDAPDVQNLSLLCVQ